MSKAINSFISVFLSIVLVFGFTPVALADPGTLDQGSAGQESSTGSNNEGQLSTGDTSNSSTEGSKDDTGAGANQEDNGLSDATGGNNEVSQSPQVVGAESLAQIETRSVDDYSAIDALAAENNGSIPEGDYYIVSDLNNVKSLDVASASKANGAKVQLYQPNMTAAQQWSISYGDDGYATITNVASGKVLDVASASTTNGTKVQQYASNNSRAQKWAIVPSGEGYTIYSALGGNIVLDVASASTSNGAKIQIYQANGSKAQSWEFDSASVSYEELDARAKASKGFLDVSDIYCIETSLAANKVVDISAASKKNSANAQIYSFNRTDAQKYRVSYDETGYVTFTNVNSGKVLDIANASVVPGANVQQYASNNSRAQKWIVEQNENGTYTISSALWTGLVLDVKGASTANKANVQIYQSNGSVAQTWNFISENELYASLDKKAEENKDVLADGAYVISSMTDNSKVLDVSGGSKSDGVNVQMWEANMSEAQQWEVTHDSKGYVVLTNLGSGKVLDVASGAAKAGANVQQYALNDSRGQKWIAEQNDDGSYTLTSAVWDSLVLDIQSGDPKNGSNIQIYTANRTNAQKFVFYDANPVVEPCEDLKLGEGYFSIATALDENYAVDILGASMADGANVQMYSSNKSYAQLYSLKFVPDGLFSSTGYYQIISACSDMAIAVDHGNVVNGSNVVQHTANANDDSQLFAIKDNGNGTYVLVNKASGLALDVADDDATNGTNLQGYTPNNQVKQRFVFNEVKDYLPEGYVVISSKLKSSMVVDVASGSLSDGANVQLYSNNGTQAQKWYVSLTEEGSNTYVIQSINSGMNLAATSGGDVVQKAPDGSDTQKWQPKISKGSTVLVNVGTGKVLDVASAGTSNGTDVRVYAANGSAAQLFTFTSTDLVAKSTYYIKPLAASSMAIDVPSNSSANGTKIQIYKKNDSGAQKWKVSKNSDGTYSIKNAQSGKALELSGTSVQINSSNNSAAQKWIFTYCTGGGIVITSSSNPSIALTVSNGSFAASSSVVGAADEGLNTQKFTFEKTMYIPSNVPSNFRAMYTKAYSNSSATDWLILVDRGNHLLGVFQGGKENWNLVKALRCTTGKFSTPTPAGVTVTTNKYYYHSQSYWRTVIFNGMYGIHSVVNGDWELGKSSSNGCIRINRNEAIWLYRTVPLGTTVIVY